MLLQRGKRQRGDRRALTIIGYAKPLLRKGREMPEAEPIKPNVYPDHVFPSLAIVTSEMDQLCHGATALPEGSILNGDMGGQAVLEDTPELSVLDVVAVEKKCKN